MGIIYMGIRNCKNTLEVDCQKRKIREAYTTYLVTSRGIGTW